MQKLQLPHLNMSQVESQGIQQEIISPFFRNYAKNADEVFTQNISVVN